MNLLRNLYADQRQMDGAVLTTFPFTAPYFEDVVQPALSRKGIERPVVLTDPETYANTLATDREVTPSGVGRSYLFEPVVMEAGYRFHPKLFFFGSSDRAYAYIGSANLTEQALTSNQEVITYFECEPDDDPNASAMYALKACRAFLVQLLDEYGSEIGKAATMRIESTLAVTDWLTYDEPVDSDIAIIHSLSKPILPEVETQIEERGETLEAVQIATPYFGSGLRVPHRFTDAGIETTLWLQQRQTQIVPDALEKWVEASEAAVEIFETTRFVHGKVLELQTDTSVYCLFGSPNASQAALLGTPHNDGMPRGNVELAVLRRATDSTYFSYLFESEPFITEDRPPLNAFVPGVEQDNFDGISARETDLEILLLDIGFAKSEVFSGGQLHGRVRLPSDEQLRGTIRITSTDEDRSPVTINLQPRDGVQDASGCVRVFTRRITDSVAVSTLQRPAKAAFTYKGQKAPGRWVAIESVTMTEETKKAVSNAGTETVWKSLHDVFFGNVDQRDEKLEFLGVLADRLTSLNSQTSRRRLSSEESTDEPEDDDEGLRLPKWSRSSRSRSPAALLKQYYENWSRSIDPLGRSLDPGAPEQFAERMEIIGDRLAGCNRMSVWLEAFRLDLQHRETEDEIPLDLPRRYTKELYSQTEPGFEGENTALLAWLCERVQRMNSQQASVELQIHVLPNVIFGAVIAHRQIADDRSTICSYYGTDFEELVLACYSDLGIISSEAVDSAVQRVRDLTVEIRTEAEQFQDFNRRLPSEFVSESALRRFVADLFGRAIVVGDVDLSGEEVTSEIRTAIERYRSKE